MANSIQIPKDLYDAGYRLHQGTAEDGEVYCNKYWWTWAYRSLNDCPHDEFETPELAIEDARRNKSAWEKTTGQLENPSTPT